MRSDFTLDIDALLAPLPGDAPAGNDPREDSSAQSLYYRLRDARAEARDAERQSDSGGSDLSGSPPQWRTVRDLATRLLKDRAKDLEAAAWLTEALVREAGFAGLTAGATLIRGLAAGFWDSGLFPLPDEDGLASLVAPISGLNGVTADGTLAQAIRKQVMFVRPDGREMTFWEYSQVLDVEKIGDATRKKARLATGVPTFAEVERDARAAGAAHFAALRAELDAALLAWNTMSAVLDEKAGADAPSTGRVRDLLAELLASLNQYAPARTDTPAEVSETVPEDATASTVGVTASSAAAVLARPVTRDDMLGELARVAEYFRKFEPQSPLSLTLDEAIRRARLTWPELLAEVMENEDTRNAMMVQLGIRPSKKAQ